MANLLAAQRFPNYVLDLVYLRGSRSWEAELATESACDEVSRRTGVDEGCNLWQCRKSVPPKSFTFTLRDRGGVSQLTGRKEDIRKHVVPEKFASSVRFAVVRGLPCDVERLPLVELVLPVSDVGCFAEFHVTFKRCTPGSSALSKVVRKTSDGCSSTCSGVGQNPQHAPVSLWLKNLVSTS